MNNFQSAFSARSLLSPLMFWVSVVVAFGLNFGDAVNGGNGYWLERLALVTGLQAALFGAIWLSYVTVIRHLPAIVRPTMLLIAYLGFASLRGIALGWGLYLVGASPEVIIATRVLSSIVQAILVTVLATSYGILTNNAELGRDLALAQAQLRQLAERVESRRREDNSALVESVTARLARDIDVSRDDTPDAVLSRLRTSIDDVVRPLSRAIDAGIGDLPAIPEVAAIEPRIDWRGAWRRALDSNEIRILPTVGMLGLVAIPTLLRVFNPLELIVLEVVIMGMSAFLLWFLRALMRFTPEAVRTRALIPVAALTSIPVSAVTASAFPPERPTTYVWLSVFIFIVLGVVPAAFSTAAQQTGALATKLQEQNAELAWTVARTREIIRQQRKAVSTALHGSVQAALTAAHIRLQIAIRDNLDVAAAVAQAQAEAEAAVRFAVDFDAPPPPMLDVVDNLTATWDGICRVRRRLAVNDLKWMDTDPVCARAVAEILLETTFNAVKHGNAEYVEIDCTWPNWQSLELIVSNNGTALDPSAKGLGSQLLDEATIEWSRESRNGVTVVRALIPWDGLLTDVK